MPTPVLMDSLGPKTGSSQKGRKKKATESTQKTKKQSQRGMGVAKLEEQRQKELIGSTQFLHQPFNQYYVPCSYPGFASYGSMGQLGFNQRGLGLVSPICGSGAGLGYYTGTGYGFEAPSLGLGPRELASIPSMNQFSENGGFSNKKKRVNDESLGRNGMKDIFGIGSEINGSSFFGFNLEKNQFIGAKREENRVKSPSLASYVGGNRDQEGEVVIEYDFFNQKISTDPKDDDDTPSTSYTTTTTPCNSTTTSMGSIIYAPKPIDLSLKLSY